MINEEKWINSLPGKKNKLNVSTEESISFQPATTSTKNSYNSVKKYSLLTILFVIGLIFVSAVKNETRNLQKDINNLKASIDIIKFNFDQAILDNEVITSPENISKLAKEYLNINLASYKRSQIKKLSKEKENFSNIDKIINKQQKDGKVKNLSKRIRINVAKKIDKKITEIRKLRNLYSNPETIPGEIKTQVKKEINQKTGELKSIYRSPKDIFTLEKVGKWSAIQFVKVFFGIPIVPGR